MLIGVSNGEKIMELFTQAEFFAGLFSIVGAGILIVIVVSRSPKQLGDEMANRVQETVTLLGRLDDAADSGARQFEAAGAPGRRSGWTGPASR
ncbi:fructoselysine-6-P-deglycase FrlB-like protein [Variovorax sp. GrIS 2.14]|uniref:hypothetical protein n=1 Tax=Variovorax sp. GrIS 2.14 TaxID=3071709 RepID=UPI0019A9FC33|nr:hypothetical protein [Variovorax sp.]